ncbi:MAG TPA: hypothetical protein PLK55_00860 [archaeon]|nr:hypothetical protein [archaeon]
MFLRKVILVLLILILVNSSIFAAVSEITINSGYNYVNIGKSVFFTVTADSYPALLHISSNIDDGIDFNVQNSDGSAVVSFSAQSASITEGIPTIPVGDSDIVTISAVGGGASATFTVDAVEPTNSAVISVNYNGGIPNYLNFYSGAITVDYSNGTISDSETYIDKHIVYLVPVSSLNNYSSAYTTEYVDTNAIRTKDINSLAVPIISDGNYYIVIDANDIAGNYSDSDAVKNTKVNVYFDNTEATISDVIIKDSSVGNVSTGTVYTDKNVFDLAVILSDASGIANESTMTVKLPNGGSRTDSSYSSGFLISEEEISAALAGHQVITSERYNVEISATDNVGNVYQDDFNIIVDLTPPSIPQKNELSIEDYDKNVTITWESGASSDGAGSGLKEYRVYKDDTTFTEISNQTLVCTTSTTTYTCKDADDKDIGDTIYYGVVGVDNVGNISDANTRSISTGPDNCTVKINDGDDFTNNPVVQLEIEFSDDVNAIGISCNNGSSTAIAADDNISFNLTTGTGCSTTNEEKTIYVKVISEDDPDRFSICSSDIIYDNTAPTVPTNLAATIQTDGSAKLTWTESTESVEPDTVKYRIYYSTSSNLTNTAEYKESTTNNYTFMSNQDINLYFKVSALDLRNNESALSSSVLANIKKIGPRFIIEVNPSNDVNGEIYVNSGAKTIEFLSDEALSENPQVSIKKANSSTYENILSTYDSTTKKGSATTAFVSSGINTIKITGENTKNETAYSELEIIMDSTTPDFNVTHELVDSVTYIIGLYNLPEDIFKVEYSVDDLNVIYSRQQVTDYNFSEYDLSETPDGNHTMYIHVYDKALNKKTKTFNYVVDLIDEDKVTCDLLRDKIANKLSTLEEEIDLFKAIKIIDSKLEQTINDKKTIIFTKRSEGNDKYSDQNYLSAKADYQFSLNEIQAIDDLLPEIEIIKSTTLSVIYDANVPVSLEEILDQNILVKTKALYDSNTIKVDRNFDALKIGTQNFFSVKLIIKNIGTISKEITIVENIPKSFASNVSNLIFNKEVEILVKDPIIKYNTAISPNGSEELIYTSLIPVTAVDVATKYNVITKEFNTKLPLIIDGNVSSEQLDIKKPINIQIIIYLIATILVIIIIILIIGAINNYKNKKIDIRPDSKKMMYDYFGKDGKEKQKANGPQEPSKTENTENKTQTAEEKTKKSSESDKFNEDYQYILSAIKKR